jgi:formamidopyrimidine-DNA glycosylase
MPELPEVETIRADLARHVVGRRFSGAEVLWEGSVDRPAPQAFAPALAGRQIAQVDRRGKYLLFRLDGGAALVVHLRMTGRLRWRPPGAPRDRHLRALLFLDQGQELHFEDQRKFGRLYLVEGEDALAQVLAKVGPEPLADSFSRDGLRALLERRRGVLKPLLMDQRFLAGLGNIYVDEALFRARLHPLRRSETLTPAEITRLYEGIVAALRQGIANRGTTLAAYRDAWGTAGLNQDRLLVFRRQGQPCPRCGAPLLRIRVAGRGTHLCAHCQPPVPSGEC